MSEAKKIDEIEDFTPKKPVSKRKKRSAWFWIIFWVLSIGILSGWYFYLQVKYRNVENLKPLVKIAPVSDQHKNDLDAAMSIYGKISGLDGAERSILVLFQNDMELRPGGGFLGSFGVVKMKDGKVVSVDVHDTGVFDGRIPSSETMPAPMAEKFSGMSWKLRDSNWSPDFRVNAEKAKFFYELGGGTEKFDAVVAINTNLLNSFLEITGPVKIDGYPGEYNDENAVLALEYQVEKGFAEQGIEKGDRKVVMKELAKSLIDRAQSLDFKQQLKLAQKISEHLRTKDIQVNFTDEELQKIAHDMDWTGEVKPFSGDYLMLVDANLGALKTDYCIKRSVKENVDLSGEAPQVTLEITYDHTCRTADWMTSNYYSWLRVYVPEGAWLEEASGMTEGREVVFEKELGKKVFALPVTVSIGKSQTVTVKYSLPKEYKKNPYSILIEKQSGLAAVPYEITLKESQDETAEKKFDLTRDELVQF